MKALVLFLLLAVAPFASARTVSQAGSIPGAPQTLHYEAIEDTESTNRDVIYWFHGDGGSEKEVETIAKNLSKEWDRAGYAHPKMVGISFGSSWLLVGKNSSPQSGLLDYVLSTAIPYIEKNLIKTPVGTRSLIGYSMGGFNALQAASECPRIFDRVALTSPGLVLLSPFSTDEDIGDYVKKNDPADDYNDAVKGTRVLMNWAKSVAPTPEVWSVVDPVNRAKSLVEKCASGDRGAPSFYVSGGVQDHAFYPGISQIATMMKKEGLKVSWHILPGGHGDLDFWTLARFFESRSVLP